MRYVCCTLLVVLLSGIAVAQQHLLITSPGRQH
jgi:hypothetical protein